uniref:IRS-type PTB domain-containing protein n=1 Tax=Trichuris muris TaxID=70415 RepID=A0A5S6QBP5_TRIMR
MGCVASRPELSSDETQANLFAVSTTVASGKMLNGVLKICPAGIFLYDRKRVVVHWPLQYVRRYGYGEDVFRFESGRRSESGPGVYTFQCSRAGELFYVVHGTILETGTSSSEPARIPSANSDGAAFKHGNSSGGRLCSPCYVNRVEPNACHRHVDGRPCAGCRDVRKISDLGDLQMPNSGKRRASLTNHSSDGLVGNCHGPHGSADRAPRSGGESVIPRTYYINVYPDGDIPVGRGDSNDESRLSCRPADTEQSSYFQFLCQRVPSRTKSLGSESSPLVAALPAFDQTNGESRALNYITLDVGSTSTTLSSSDSTARALHHRGENAETSAGRGSHYAVIDYMKTKALHDTTALQSRSAEECGVFFRRNRFASINDTYMRS